VEVGGIAIERWEPSRELATLRDLINRVFEETWARFGRLPTAFELLGPPIDLSETDNEVVVRAAVPGLKPEDLEIAIDDSLLTIRGETREEKKEEGAKYHYRELRWGRFERSVRLPAPVNESRAEARLEHGILTIKLPKVQPSPRRTIKIQMA